MIQINQLLLNKNGTHKYKATLNHTSHPIKNTHNLKIRTTNKKIHIQITSSETEHINNLGL